MYTSKQASDQISHALRAVRAIADTLTVPLVANLKSAGTPVGDYSASSVATEYFSENEASQIHLGLQECGFYTKLYPGEDAFISAVMDGSFLSLPRLRKLIYNTAQSGTGAGRKSLIPAFCALHGIPVCNSNPYVLSLARHKFHVYAILRTLGLPVVDSWLFDGAGWLLGERPAHGIKLIAKACYESASIGLDYDGIGELSDAYEAMLACKAAGLRQPYVVQRFIAGSEAEVPVLDFGTGAFALEPVAMTLDGNAVLGDRILDYDIVANDLGGFAPCTHLDQAARDGMKTTAEEVFRVLGIAAVGRVDFRIQSDGRFLITDIATTPHLVQHSAFAFAFGQAGFKHADVMGAVVAANARRFGWC
jgi:D-alanine-D-alanine ligase